LTKKADSPAPRYRALFSIEILVKTVFIRNLHSFTKKTRIVHQKTNGNPPSFNQPTNPTPRFQQGEDSHTQKRQIVHSNTQQRADQSSRTIAFWQKAKQKLKLTTRNSVRSGQGLKFVLKKWKDSSLMPKGYSRALVLGSYCIYIYLPRAPCTGR